MKIYFSLAKFSGLHIDKNLFDRQLTGHFLRYFTQSGCRKVCVIHDGVPSRIQHRFGRGHALEEILVQRNLDVLVSADRCNESRVDMVYIGRELNHRPNITALGTVHDVPHMR